MKIYYPSLQSILIPFGIKFARERYTDSPKHKRLLHVQDVLQLTPQLQRLLLFKKLKVAI